MYLTFYVEWQIIYKYLIESTMQSQRNILSILRHMTTYSLIISKRHLIKKESKTNRHVSTKPTVIKIYSLFLYEPNSQIKTQTTRNKKYSFAVFIHSRRTVNPNINGWLKIKRLIELWVLNKYRNWQPTWRSANRIPILLMSFCVVFIVTCW